MTRGRAAALITLLIGFGLVLLAVEAKWGPTARLDGHVAHSLYRHGRAHRGEVRFWRDVSLVLHPDVLRIAAAGAAIALALLHQVRSALLVVIAMGGQAVLETVTKLAVDRHRPSFVPALAHASGTSFPSGHAMTSFVAFGLLVLLVPSRARVPVALVSVLAVALVAYSRIALVVHYVTDIAGAWLLGGAVLVAAYSVTCALRVARASPDPPPGR